VLTLDELRHLRRTSTLRGAGLVLHAWGVIAAAMALHAWWPTPLVLLVAVVVIGSRQLGLTVLMHNYHLEHHLLIFVPCWKLPQAHALLLAKGYGPRMEMASSYGSVLWRAAGSEARAPI
jgi:fatty acid desaturase